jgi:hypothetical protein
MDNQGVFLGRLNAILCLVGVGEIAKAKAEFVEANAIAPAWIEAILRGGRQSRSGSGFSSVSPPALRTQARPRRFDKPLQRA